LLLAPSRERRGAPNPRKPPALRFGQPGASGRSLSRPAPPKAGLIGRAVNLGRGCGRSRLDAACFPSMESVFTRHRRWSSSASTGSDAKSMSKLGSEPSSTSAPARTSKRSLGRLGFSAPSSRQRESSPWPRRRAADRRDLAPEATDDVPAGPACSRCASGSCADGGSLRRHRGAVPIGTGRTCAVDGHSSTPPNYSRARARSMPL
jgi:hypothetical protein